MSRSLIWIEDDQNKGWACSYCPWRFPVPTLLSDPEAKNAYDRLATTKFREHKCETSLPVVKPAPSPDSDHAFEERARTLVTRGYKPKDAVEIVLQDLALEYLSDSRRMERARAAAEDFLRKVRKGLI
ncbi:MAG: hypothetical protein LAO09_04790 [Acidobacteriia bacterium]|nr:hypothetical protein [Terriglobia bacterium]